MNNHIGVSTGVMHTFFKDDELEKKISCCLDLPIDILEILYSRPFVLRLPLSEAVNERLQQIRVSMHAPFFGDTGYNVIKYDETIIEQLLRKGKQHNAEHIVMHPDSLPVGVKFNNREDHFVIENLKKKSTIDSKGLAQILKENQGLRLVLDTGHADDWGEKELMNLLNQFRTQIVAVHLSVDDNYRSFIEHKTQHFECLRILDCPIILESRPQKVEDLPSIIHAVRSFFSANQRAS